MQIITAAVIKGGTGKTATCVALAQAAVSAGKRVLAIDLDPSANFSLAIGADQKKKGCYELFEGSAAAADILQLTSQGIYALSASPRLSTVKTSPASGKRLKTALEPLHDAFDICLIDTPPMPGELVYNALLAATELIIPLEADTNSLQGLYQITDIAKQTQKANPDLRSMGVVLTRFDSRPNINRYLRDVIAEKGAENGAPLLTTIRPAVAIKEAISLQQSLYEYAPKSTAARDYKKLLDMILEG